MGRRGCAISLSTVKFNFLSVLAFMLLTASLAYAQSTATLQGAVNDPAGAGVPSARVVATNQGTGVESVTQTDSAGSYLFPALSIGVYRLEVAVPGFQTVRISDLKLDVATTVTRDVTLKVGQASETIEVQAQIPLVDTSTTSVGQVINDKTVYPDDETLKRLFVITARDPATQRIINRLGTKVKTGR